MSCDGENCAQGYVCYEFPEGSGMEGMMACAAELGKDCS